MVTPEFLEYELNLMKTAEELEESIIRDMSRRIAKAGALTDTAAWQAEIMQESGMLLDDIIKKVSDSTKLMEKEIRQFFDDTEEELFKYDGELLEGAGIDALQFKRFSPTMLGIWSAAVSKVCTDAVNLTKTTALTSQSSFISACDLAVMQVSSGAFSHNQAITNAIRRVCDTGGFVRYPSGRVDKLDVAVRRAVLTGVNQTAGQVMLMQAERFGHDLMEISAHSGARPEHTVWQGRIVSLSGDTRGGKYLSIDDIGYQTPEGFQGINCRHTWWMFFEGASRVKYTDDELRKMSEKTVMFKDIEFSEYEASQRMRKQERKIRAVRRELVGLDEALKNANDEELKQNLKTEFAAESVKLKRLEKELRLFASETGLTLDKNRIQVYNTGEGKGFDRSVSGKAVHTAKKEAEKYTRYLYNSDGTIYVTDNWMNNKKHINRNYKPYAVIQTKEVKGSYVQLNRTYYDKNGEMCMQIHTGHHGFPAQHNYGTHGEHKHNYGADETGKFKKLDSGELDSKDRKENSDIL